MVSIHHANAKTTARVRKEIQDSDETIAQLSERLSLNHKTVLYWKHAGRVTDKKSEPRNPRSMVLTPCPNFWEHLYVTGLILLACHPDVFIC